VKISDLNPERSEGFQSEIFARDLKWLTPLRLRVTRLRVTPVSHRCRSMYHFHMMHVMRLKSVNSGVLIGLARSRMLSACISSMRRPLRNSLGGLFTSMLCFFFFINGLCLLTHFRSSGVGVVFARL
jgi:hypothetical protein